MFEASVTHASHGEFLLQGESKESMHRETAARQREREEREGVIIDGTVLGVILFRLTENFILMNDISEKTWNEGPNKLFLVKKQLRENNT